MTTEEQHQYWDRWSRWVAKEFRPLLLPFAGKPITYVEIGCWAGASAEWVAKNVLTHPDSRGVGIDPYYPERLHPQTEIDAIVERATSRLKEAIGERWMWKRRESVVALRTLPDWFPVDRCEIDILYIDGCHDSHAVVQDFALAWPFLRVGSIVIFDDYQTSKENHVMQGYRAVRMGWKGLIEETGIERQNRQRAVKVVKKEYR